MDYLESTFSKVNQQKYQLFLLDDFNVDLLQYESHSYTNDFLNTMISNSFLSYMHQPTRVTDHSETVINNIFSNISNYETASGNITSVIADHFAQFLLIKKCYVSFKSCDYYVYDYSKFGREKFTHEFSLLDWSPIDDPFVSVNDHFDYFLEKTTTCIASHLPKKKITKRNLKVKTKPWINGEIKKNNLMSNRDKFFKKMAKNSTSAIISICIPNLEIVWSQNNISPKLSIIKIISKSIKPT